MATVLYDGDFTVAQIAGEAEFEIPFKSDPKPYAYSLKYWQFLNSFEDIPFGTPGPLGGTYVGGSQGSFKGVGGGVIEFKREFALVPDSRNEWESFAYSHQFLTYSIGINGVTELTIVTQSRVQFDYFQTDEPGLIDIPRAPKVWKSTETETLFLNGALGILNPPCVLASGTEVLAEDSTFKIWNGNIYQRKMRFIKWINRCDLVTV